MFCLRISGDDGWGLIIIPYLDHCRILKVWTYIDQLLRCEQEDARVVLGSHLSMSHQKHLYIHGIAAHKMLCGYLMVAAASINLDDDNPSSPASQKDFQKMFIGASAHFSLKMWVWVWVTVINSNIQHENTVYIIYHAYNI